MKAVYYTKTRINSLGENEGEAPVFLNDGVLKKLDWKDFSNALTRTNAGELVDAASGFQIAIDTLTYIVKEITQQKFYEVAPSEFLPIVVEGAYSSQFLHNLATVNGNDFETGVSTTNQRKGRMDSIDVTLKPLFSKVVTWNKVVEYSLVEVQQALRYNNFDIIAERHEAMKKHYDLGIQKIAFLGSDTDEDVKGLLTIPGITVNTTTITKSISSMTAAEFNTLIGKLLADYAASTNFTAMPDTFIIPYSDYVGLQSATSEQFPIKTKLQFLEDALRTGTGNAKFAVKYLAYANADKNSTGKALYQLYKNDKDCLLMRIPVPYMVHAPGTANNFTFEQVCFSQYTGVLAKRPNTIVQYQF